MVRPDSTLEQYDPGSCQAGRWLVAGQTTRHCLRRHRPDKLKNDEIRGRSNGHIIMCYHFIMCDWYSCMKQNVTDVLNKYM